MFFFYENHILKYLISSTYRCWKINWITKFINGNILTENRNPNAYVIEWQ